MPTSYLICAQGCHRACQPQCTMSRKDVGVDFFFTPKPTSMINFYHWMVPKTGFCPWFLKLQQ